MVSQGNIQGAMALARAGLDLIRRRSLSSGGNSSRVYGKDGAEETLSPFAERWHFFTSPRVDHFFSTSSFSDGGRFKSAEHRTVLLPDERTLPLISLGNLQSGGLPPFGSNLHMAGFELDGVFYADEDGHECSAGEEGVGVWCVFPPDSPGAPPPEATYFSSMGEASIRGSQMREAGWWAARNLHGALVSPNQLRERELSNAASSLSSFSGKVWNWNNVYQSPIKANAAGTFTSVLVFRLAPTDYVPPKKLDGDGVEVLGDDPYLPSKEQLEAAGFEFSRVAYHSFGKISSVRVTVLDCLYMVPKSSTRDTEKDTVFFNTNDPFMLLRTGAATEALKKGSKLGCSSSWGDEYLNLAANIGSYQHIAMFVPGNSQGFQNVAVSLSPGTISAYKIMPSDLAPAAFLKQRGVGFINSRRGFPFSPIFIAALLAHNVGNNWGPGYANSLPTILTGDGIQKYGDDSSLMGSQPDIVYGDWTPNDKHYMGWIDDAYVLKLARVTPPWQGSSSSTTIASSATFNLAAYDRETSPSLKFPYLLDNTYLAVRLAVTPTVSGWGPLVKGGSSIDFDSSLDPDSLYIGFQGADPYKFSQPGGGATPSSVSWSGVTGGYPFLDLQPYRGPGIYLRTGRRASTAKSSDTLVFCYRDSSCINQYPLEPNDALVFDYGGENVLIEAGVFKTTAYINPLSSAPPASSYTAPSAINSASQNGAITTRVVYLDWNGSPLDKTQATSHTPTYVDADASMPASPIPLTATLSVRNTVAVFLFQPTAVTLIKVTPSCSGSNLDSLGFSVFMGAFPTAHAFYGGNIGYSGDIVASCSTPFAFSAGPSSPVWVVAGQRGSQKLKPDPAATITLTYIPGDISATQNPAGGFQVGQSGILPKNLMNDDFRTQLLRAHVLSHGTGSLTFSQGTSCPSSFSGVAS